MLQEGLEPELREILEALGCVDAEAADRPALEQRLSANKTRYAAELAARVSADLTLAARMPRAFRDAIGDLRGLT